MSEIDPGDLYPLLNQKSGLKIPLGNDILANVRLPQYQMKSAMGDLGRYLASLHQVHGEGFGLIDPKQLGKGKLVGSNKSWYEFVLSAFQTRLKDLNDFKSQEEKAGKHLTKLSRKNRDLMEEVLGQKDFVIKLIQNNRRLLESVRSCFLNGNVYLGSIAVKDGKFVGLFDFRQPLLGDPVNDLAYFSVMPQGDKYINYVLKGWQEKMKDSKLENKLHLYRLLESYRKIIRRYVKYQYLEDYPEPLKIAREELSYYNRG